MIRTRLPRNNLDFFGELFNWFGELFNWAKLCF
jgi:hypothetical protein